MSEPPIISTPRLLLKGITPSFIHHLFEIKNEQEIRQLFNFDKEGYNQLRSRHEAGMETYHLSLFYFLLIDKTLDLPIGECGFHTWNKKHARAELFYSMSHDSYKQKGLMTEALQEILDFGFHALQLHRIEALVAD